MVKLGLLNSRMKDFYDIWLMIHPLDFNGEQFTEALKTFKHRKTLLPQNRPLERLNSISEIPKITDTVC